MTPNNTKKVSNWLFLLIGSMLLAQKSDCMSTKGQKFASSSAGRTDQSLFESESKNTKSATATAPTTEDPFSFGSDSNSG